MERQAGFFLVKYALRYNTIRISQSGNTDHL
jgi:hypothetical protein